MASRVSRAARLVLLASLLAACGERADLRRVGEQPVVARPGQEILDLADADLELVGERLLARRRHVRLDDPPLEAAIRAVACRLDAARCPGLRVQLIEAPSPSLHAWPGGHLEISTGMALRIGDEAELAALLAHELAHARLGHRAAAFEAAQRALWPLTTGAGPVEAPAPVVARSPFALPAFASAYVAGYWETMSNVVLLSVTPMVVVSPFVPFVLAEEASRALPVPFDVDLELEQLPYPPEAEREAEGEAAALLARGGYEPGAAARLWARLAREEAAGDRGSARTRTFLETHPGSAERFAGLEGAARPLGDGRRSALPAPGWAAVVPGRRLGWLAREIDRGRWNRSLVLVDQLLARERQAVDLLWARAELLRRRGDAADTEAARAILAELARDPRAPAATWRSLGLVLDRIGRGDEAAAALRTYLLRYPETPERALIEARLAAGRWLVPGERIAPADDASRPRLEVSMPRARRSRYELARTSFGSTVDALLVWDGLPAGEPLASESSLAVAYDLFPSPAPHRFDPDRNELELVELLGTLLARRDSGRAELLAAAPAAFAGGAGVRAEWRIRDDRFGLDHRALALLRVVDGRLFGIVFRAAAFGPWVDLSPEVETIAAEARLGKRRTGWF